MADGGGLELKGALEGFQRTVEAFKSKNDERFAELSKKLDDVVTKETLDRIAQDLTETKAAINAEVAALKRSKASADDGDDLEVKQIKFNAVQRALVDEYFRDKGAKNVSDLRCLRDDQELKAALADLEIKDLNTVIASDGGYMVLPEYISEMVEIYLETSAMRNICQVRETGTREVQMPVNMKGANAVWINELGTRTGTNTPTLERLRVSVDEIYALPQISEAMLEDAEFDVESWLSSEVAEAFEIAENLAFVSGDGNGKPRGFTTYTKTAVGSYDSKTNWGTHAFRVTGVSAAFPTVGTGVNQADPLVRLIFDFKKPYRENLDWAMTRQTLGVVRTLKDGQGQYVVRDIVSMDEGVMTTCLGYPIEELEDMDEIGADTFSIALGDFYKGYLILDRIGIQTKRDDITKPGNQIFHFRKRVGGACLDFDAIKFLKFGTS